LEDQSATDQPHLENLLPEKKPEEVMKCSIRDDLACGGLTPLYSSRAMLAAKVIFIAAFGNPPRFSNLRNTTR
jgi:hypothetical protein